MDTETGISKHARDLNREQARQPVLGQVTKVWTRTTTDDTGPDALSNHEASVLLQSGREEPRRLPIHQDFPGTAGVPKPGDFVRVDYLRGITERAVIVGYAYDDTENRPPLAQPGHWRREFNGLYIEAERTDHAEIDPDDGSDYDVIRLAKKADGLSNPTTQVSIDDSGASTQVKIETDGDITISAGGDIVIEEGGTATPVAKQNHTHDYQDDDGTSTTTKTTTTPNESGTNVEIE